MTELSNISKPRARNGNAPVLVWEETDPETSKADWIGVAPNYYAVMSNLDKSGEYRYLGWAVNTSPDRRIWASDNVYDNNLFDLSRKLQDIIEEQEKKEHHD